MPGGKVRGLPFQAGNPGKTDKVTRCLEWLAQAQAGQLVEKVLDQALVGGVASANDA